MSQSVASQHTVDTQLSCTSLNNDGHHFSHSVASGPIVHPHSKRVGINLKRAASWSRPWMQGVRDTLGIHPDGGLNMFENCHQRGWYSTMWNTFGSDAVNTCEDIAWIIGSSFEGRKWCDVSRFFFSGFVFVVLATYLLWRIFCQPNMRRPGGP